MSDLDRPIHQTLRYFDLFDQPLTATQVWLNLLAPPVGKSARWDGQRVRSLKEVREALRQLRRQGEVESRWGYYCLPGRLVMVEERLRRHVQAQEKWRLTRRLAWWLALVPLVRMLAMSGSLARGNTRTASDLDIFIVTAPRRIWLSRLLLLMAAQLTGRRRKYWNEEAPDMLCLNHYLTEADLSFPPAIRNVYTAASCRQILPLTGWSSYVKFQQVNGPWIRRFLMSPELPRIPAPHLMKIPGIFVRIRGWWSRWLEEPGWDFLEVLAERWQRRSIARHAKESDSEHVRLSARELAFHPDTKVPQILARFARDEGQKQLV